MSNIELLIVDPQNDFMDQDGAALGVPGAQDDMRRVANLIKKNGAAFADITATMDTHRVLDIAHPDFWRDQNGNAPDPFTMIMADDIRRGKFLPRHPAAKPEPIKGKTIRDYAIGYAEELEQEGKKALIIWPEHCVIGSWGHNIYKPLLQALNDWERQQFATVEYVAKGTNVFTEHYGAMQAEVPLANAPETQMNIPLLEKLQRADMLAVAGEASSHCVMETVNQVADFFGEEGLNKIVLLENAMSPVPRVGDGPDFPAMAEAWMADMRNKGLQVMEVDEFARQL